MVPGRCRHNVGDEVQQLDSPDEDVVNPQHGHDSLVLLRQLIATEVEHFQQAWVVEVIPVNASASPVDLNLGVGHRVLILVLHSWNSN